jgi:NTE family protein
MNKSKDIALVLGSGGARGIAHIAIIEELMKAGFTIKSIAGSSIGALIGSVYAGGNLTGLRRWLQELNYWNVFQLMDFSISNKGFIKGEKVFDVIDPYLPKGNIEDLEIPFVAVTADILNKKSIVLNSGNIRDAVRASISIPTVLKPVEKNGTLYVDGSIVNPIPVDLVKRHTNDLLVVVDLNAHLPKPNVKITKSQQSRLDELANMFLKWHTQSKSINNLGVFDMLNESFDLTQDMLAAQMLQNNKPDIHIKISRKACDTMDFHKSDKMLAIGKEVALKAIEEFNQRQ